MSLGDAEDMQMEYLRLAGCAEENEGGRNRCGDV